jgi:hypothetical protein
MNRLNTKRDEDLVLIHTNFRLILRKRNNNTYNQGAKKYEMLIKIN